MVPAFAASGDPSLSETHSTLTITAATGSQTSSTVAGSIVFSNSGARTSGALTVALSQFKIKKNKGAQLVSPSSTTWTAAGWVLSGSSASGVTATYAAGIPAHSSVTLSFSAAVPANELGGGGSAQMSFAGTISGPANTATVSGLLSS
ncbi:hypothetical protein GCM10028801_11760 [Nocardioides maradonensis]